MKSANKLMMKYSAEFALRSFCFGFLFWVSFASAFIFGANNLARVELGFLPSLPSPQRALPPPTQSFSLSLFLSMLPHSCDLWQEEDAEEEGHDVPEIEIVVVVECGMRWTTTTIASQGVVYKAVNATICAVLAVRAGGPTRRMRNTQSSCVGYWHDVATRVPRIECELTTTESACHNWAKGRQNLVHQVELHRSSRQSLKSKWKSQLMWVRLVSQFNRQTHWWAVGYFSCMMNELTQGGLKFSWGKPQSIYQLPYFLISILWNWANFIHISTTTTDNFINI